MENDDSLIQSLLPAVDEQLASEHTPYVKTTFTRLVEKEGVSPDQAREMIAYCLAVESNRMFVDQKAFNTERYQQHLELLPEVEV